MPESLSPNHIPDVSISEVSATTTDHRIEALRDLFPEAFTDGVLDMVAISRIVEPFHDDSERYGLSWAGKSSSQKALSMGTTATLHPDLAESSGFDNAENVFIEGDNLEVLRLLQRAYVNKFKLIYIDPPYNTGNDFVYSDDFSQGLDAYLRFTGQVTGEGTRKSSKTDTAGRRHSGWLSMMYPRLSLAQNLLADDGAIFVSIDDNEVHNLRLLMDETFGMENFIGQFVWAAGRKNDSKFVSTSHEYMLVYAKNMNGLRDGAGSWRVERDGLDDVRAEFKRQRRAHKQDHAAVATGMKKWFSERPDNDPAKRMKEYQHVDARGLFMSGDSSASVARESRSRTPVNHPVTGEPCPVPANGWRWQVEELLRRYNSGELLFGLDATTVPRAKGYLEDRTTETPYSVFYQDGQGATKRLRTLLGDDLFNHPKDETLLQRVVQFASGPDDLVLDFFAGSGSFGHAVMAQNKADGGNRRFVLVTLDEQTDNESVARKAGIQTIPEITRMRMRRAAKVIHGDDAPDLRCFRLGASNFRSWDPAAAPTDKDGLSDYLDNFVVHVDAGASPESIAAEVMVKEGVPLHEAWQWEEFAGGRAVIVGDHTAVCLHEKVTFAVLDGIALLGVERCVMLESSFVEDDEAKTNAFYRLRDAKIAFRTI